MCHWRYHQPMTLAQVSAPEAPARMPADIKELYDTLNVLARQADAGLARRDRALARANSLELVRRSEGSKSAMRRRSYGKQIRREASIVAVAEADVRSAKRKCRAIEQRIRRSLNAPQRVAETRQTPAIKPILVRN
jgi:hypothetical protein